MRITDPGARHHAPATLRNREPILEVLEGLLPRTGTVLEIASGSGEHAAFFSNRLAPLVWQPSDADGAALESIAAWGAAEGGPGWRSPLQLDATRHPWPIDAADAIVSINMLHISPWESCEGLMRGAAAVLPAGGPLYLYGPFLVEATPTATSNVAFDQSLRARDARWGLRALEAVAELADTQGLALDRTVSMPANNLSVIFRKR